MVAAQAGIPDEVEFATKPILARQMLARALDGGLPVSWATADEAYGMDYKFRSFLERRGVSYVVAVPKNQMVAGATVRADTLGHMGPSRRKPPPTWHAMPSTRSRPGTGCCP
ncbi:transposase [Microbispora triticiradicis]|uniref:Transposase n=2 Tax=Microbispora TaxID=2005 RepID=A0ABY3M3L8_9ACTN|nr:transposase [Microbispora fusca]TYB65639.1 transposase [Microbispora tritici]